MKIEIGEHCFGSYATVDGIDICEEEHVDKKLQKDYRGAILLEIMKNMDNLPNYYWRELADMVVSNNPRYKIDNENSYHDTCEQCGNWNSNVIYNKL